MIEKPIDQIKKEDIESLVAAKVGERRTLDYKQKLPEKTADALREFLYDVASFANASGGDIVFGITDERDADGKSTGLPGAAEGVAATNLSDTISRLENAVRDGIDPRVQGLRFQSIDGFPKGLVVVLRIPRSWASPHMVTSGGVSRFYSRNSTGKYPLDVREIRAAFLAHAGIEERIRRFVMDRVSKATQGEGPVTFKDGAKLLLHLIPVSALDDGNVRDLTKEASEFRDQLAPLSRSSFGARFNFDGILVTGYEQSYVQVFRSGIIEAGEGQLFRHNNSIPSISFEETLWSGAARYLRFLQKVEIDLPTFVVATLIGVKGYHLGLSSRYMFYHDIEQVKIDRDILSLPELLIEDYKTNMARALRPTFDALWQACGLKESLNYSPEGDWKRHE